jgi:hypothetical protein
MSVEPAPLSHGSVYIRSGIVVRPEPSFRAVRVAGHHGLRSGGERGLGVRGRSYHRGVTTDELRKLVDEQATLMVAVATGGPAIDSVQREYAGRRTAIVAELRRRGLDDPNPYRDLWRWYAFYSSKMPTYRERRIYIGDLYDPLRDALERVGSDEIGTGIDDDARTGWERVDDQMVQLRERFKAAETTEDFQGIGLRCREVFVSLGRACYDEDEHGPAESLVDRLYSAIEAAAPGGANKELRKLLKAGIDYANKLQHDSDGTRQHARIAAEVTAASVTVMRTLLAAEPSDEGGTPFDDYDIPF